jgi:hypothetical protein
VIRRVLEAINEDDVREITYALKKRGWKQTGTDTDSRIANVEKYNTETDECYWDDEEIEQQVAIFEGPYEGMTVELHTEEDDPYYLLRARISVRAPLDRGHDLPLITSMRFPKDHIENLYSELVPETTDGILKAIRRIADGLKLKRKRKRS